VEANLATFARASTGSFEAHHAAVRTQPFGSARSSYDVNPFPAAFVFDRPPEVRGGLSSGDRVMKGRLERVSAQSLQQALPFDDEAHDQLIILLRLQLVGCGTSGNEKQVARVEPVEIARLAL